MKSTCCLFLFAIALLSGAREQAKESPPAEMKKADFMLGVWTNSETVTDGVRKAKITYGMSISKSLGGRYLLVKHIHNSPGEPDVEGMHMLTYDPDKKVWLAWWFLSTETGATELSGNFEKNKLVMQSRPFKSAGMPGEQVIRASWQPTANKGLRFILEFKQGRAWAKFIDRTYAKK